MRMQIVKMKDLKGEDRERKGVNKVDYCGSYTLNQTCYSFVFFDMRYREFKTQTGGFIC